MSKLFASSLLVLLAACSTPKVIYRDRPVTVNKPVVQPCAGERPEAVTSLYERTPDWAEMDARQKAAATGQWALDLMNYGEQLDAATGACP